MLEIPMKDHEKRELVSRITAVALEYRDAEQLRERIGGAVLPAIDAAVAAERERCCRVVVVQCDDARLEVARRTILAIRAGDDYHGDVDRDGLLRA